MVTLYRGKVEKMAYNSLGVVHCTHSRIKHCAIIYPRLNSNMHMLSKLLLSVQLHLYT